MMPMPQIRPIRSPTPLASTSKYPAAATMPMPTPMPAGSDIPYPPTVDEAKSRVGADTTYKRGGPSASASNPPRMTSPNRSPTSSEARARRHGARLPPLPKDGPHSLTLQFAHNLTSDVLFRAVPRHANPHDAVIYESKGASFVDAQRAMFGTHRSASERFYWTLPMEHDARVRSLFDWVEQMAWALANHGVCCFALRRVVLAVTDAMRMIVLPSCKNSSRPSPAVRSYQTQIMSRVPIPPSPCLTG